MNLTRFKNYIGKEGLYFHGASNDRTDNPDHKKILPPSPEHPFFVSDDPVVAYRYANLETDQDGRVTDNDTEFTENSRIYVLRLKEDVANTKNYFDFTDKNDIEKLKPLFSSAEGFDIFRNMILEKRRMFFYVCLQLAGLDIFNIHDDIAGKTNPMEMANRVIKQQTSVKETIEYATLYGSLVHHFKSHPDRRQIKAVFFKYILEKLHIKVVGEYDTWGSYWHPGDKIVEFGILDKSAIKDIYPFPIPYSYAEHAARLTTMYIDKINPINLSKSSYFLSLVNFMVINPKIIFNYPGEDVVRMWMDDVMDGNVK